MQPHQQRVVEEKQELDDKLGKLLTFIDAGKGVIFSTLNNEDRERLTTQARIMREYSDVLADRIAAFPSPVDNKTGDGSSAEQYAYCIQFSEYKRPIIYLAESSWYDGVATNRAAFLNRDDAVAWAQQQARAFIDFATWQSSTDDYPYLKNYDDARNLDKTHLSPTFIATWNNGHVKVTRIEVEGHLAQEKK